MTTRLYYAVAAGLMCCCGMARAADTLEDVEKKIAAEADKVKTMTAKSVTTMENEMTGMSSKTKSEGPIETARRGEKYFMRAELKTTSAMKMGEDPEKKTEAKTLSIMDGEYLYTLSESEGTKTAMKMKLDPKMSAPMKDAFEQMHKEYEIKLLDDDKVDGKAVYVIQTTPKKSEPDTTMNIKTYYTKEGGMMVKSVTTMKSPQMKMSSTTLMTDIKINPDIKPERFVFKAPEGVEVQDMTKMMTTQPSEAKPADDKPADQAKDQPKDQPKEEKKADTPPPEKKKSKIPKIPGLGK